MSENKETLERGSTLLLGGPASAKLLEGEVEIFGHRPKKGETIVSRPHRVLPIHALTDAKLELSLGTGHSINIVQGNTIPDTWINLLNALKEKSRIIVLGGIDSGKTSLITYLHNYVLKSGIEPVVVDLDIGQSDICPPTTMAYSSQSSKTVPSLHLLRPEKIYPVGYTSPSYNPNEALCMAMNILRRNWTTLTLINTDGWIGEGAADWYKSSLIDVAMPSHIALLGVEPGPLLKEAMDRSGAEIIMLDIPSVVSTRSQEARRVIREMNYARFLRGASLRTIPLSWINFKILEQRNETHISIVDFLNDVLSDIERCGCPASKKVIGHEGVDFSDIGIGIVSYVLGDDDSAVGLALFMGIDSKRQVARIYTPYRDTIRRLAIGGVILSLTGEELHVYRQRL